MFRSLIRIRPDGHYGLCEFSAISRSLQSFGGVSRVSIRQGAHGHRMVGVGRDLFGSPSPTPLPKQGRLQ